MKPLPIPGHDGYFAFEDGRIMGRKDHLLSPHTNRATGYQSVGLYFNGQKVCRRVNVLVCLAFHGTKPTPLHDAAHNDGNKLNNRADNLRWATKRENQADRVVHGTTCRGSRNGFSKLTERAVATIREAYRAALHGRARVAPGFRQRLATQLGVNPSCISKVVAGESWGVRNAT